MKKSFITISAVIVGTLFTESSFAAFRDIPATDPDITAYNYVQTQGIMIGSEDGNFHPGLGLTRCELVKVALLASRAQLSTDSSGTFPDIAITHWCNQYAKTARAQGIISGYPDGTFRPNQKVTQIEALKILINSGRNGIMLEPMLRQKYTDVRTSDWWAPYIQFAQDTLYSENPIYLRRSASYGINTQMPRAETAYLVWKLFSSYPSTATTWRTSENASFGVAINYPQGWLSEVDTDQPISQIITFTSPNTLEIRNSLPPQQMECYSCGSDLEIWRYESFAHFKESYLSTSTATTLRDLIEDIDTMTIVGETSVDGTNALKVVQDVAFPFYSLFVEKNGHVYIFAFNQTETESGLTATELNMLASVRFL
jgi:hypothetical protein